MELNSITIDGLRTTGTRYEIIDKETQGLRLRVETSGTKIWYFRGSVNSKRILRRLGTYPAMTVRGARRQVTSIRDGGVTFSEGFLTLEEMLVAYARATRCNYQGMLMERSLRKHPKSAENGIFSCLPDRPEDVKVSDITHYVDLLHDRTSLADGSIRNMLAFMKRVYAHHMLRGRVDTNPFSVFFDLNKTLRGQDQILKPSQPRKRYLTDDQIELGLDMLTGDHRDYFKLLLLTGLRRNEGRLLHASEICLAEGSISLPRERKKNNRDHKVALSSLAQAILKPRLVGGGYIFPYLQKRSPTMITGFFGSRIGRTPHDLRRTLSRELNRMGCPGRIVSKILSHTPQEDGTAPVTMDYTDELSNHRLPEQRIWLEKLADKFCEEYPQFKA